MSRRLTDADPREAWLPYEPASGTLSRREAAHLVRRAGFGAPAAQLDELAKLGPADATRQLLEPGPRAAEFDQEMHRFAQLALATNSPEQLSGWWLHRMRHTPAPLLEKTTLFWHGHFATSGEKVRDARLLLAQNELFREHALGSFEALVRGIARDPAMLLYLDSATNRKTHPNENFAREVMELFCLGVGRYSEQDIQELARCFTGWEIQHGAFKFNQYQHDYGSKTVLGRTAKMDGDEGLAVILEQPATPEFLCTKLVRYFVADEDDIPAELIAPLAEKFRTSGLTVAPVVETILTSRLFYSDLAIGRKIRSPVELAIGLLSSLETSGNMVQLSQKLKDLGQMVFFPPNVKGWAGGRTWINSSTLLGRANLVRALLENGDAKFGGTTLDAYFARLNLKTGNDIVAYLSDVLLAVPIPAEASQGLATEIDRRGAKDAAALKRVVHVLASLPEFQLA
jgi:uncharacterized protein (DUF1800 family)